MRLWNVAIMCFSLCFCYCNKEGTLCHDEIIVDWKRSGPNRDFGALHSSKYEIDCAAPLELPLYNSSRISRVDSILSHLRASPQFTVDSIAIVDSVLIRFLKSGMAEVLGQSRLFEWYFVRMLALDETAHEMRLLWVEGLGFVDIDYYHSFVDQLYRVRRYHNDSLVEDISVYAVCDSLQRAYTAQILSGFE